MKNPYFGGIFFAKQRLITRKLRVQDVATGNHFSFNQCSFSRKLFYKSNRKLFPCVCISWYKHSRRWENYRQLCKPSTSSRVCITVSNSPNPSRVYIRLCKHGKRFLLLKCSLLGNRLLGLESRVRTGSIAWLQSERLQRRLVVMGILLICKWSTTY